MAELRVEVVGMADDDAVSPVLAEVMVTDQVVGDAIGQVSHGAVGGGHHRLLIAIIIAGDRPVSPEGLPFGTGYHQIPCVGPFPLCVWTP